MRYLLFAAFFFQIFCANGLAQDIVLPLYPGAVPNNFPGTKNRERSVIENGILKLDKISVPSLEIYLPANRKYNGPSVIICPGGGYSIVAAGHEGASVAKEFNRKGIVAFVLRYRIPDSSISPEPGIAPLQDIQQAFIQVRSHASQWHIDVRKVGVLGFSAGGHLASTISTHFNKCLVPNPSGISVRPDFSILVYSVISASSDIMNKGSFRNLLGKDPSDSLLNYYSNEKQVNADTPPAILIHSADDNAVPPENSIVYFKALLNAGVPAELHIYQAGGHGYGLHIPGSEEKWIIRVLNWMQYNGWGQ